MLSCEKRGCRLKGDYSTLVKLLLFLDEYDSTSSRIHIYMYLSLVLPSLGYLTKKN
jgi:hypothetical protein